MASAQVQEMLQCGLLLELAVRVAAGPARIPLAVEALQDGLLQA
jgi:hypothetical protein